MDIEKLEVTISVNSINNAVKKYIYPYKYHIIGGIVCATGMNYCVVGLGNFIGENIDKRVLECSILKSNMWYQFYYLPHNVIYLGRAGVKYIFWIGNSMCKLFEQSERNYEMVCRVYERTYDIMRKIY